MPKIVGAYGASAVATSSATAKPVHISLMIHLLAIRLPNAE